MIIFRKIYIRSLRLYRIFLFNIPIIDISVINNKWQMYKKPKPYKNQKIFYLKVNRDILVSYSCIDYWLEIAYKMDAFVYFICDNNYLKWNIIKNCKFFNNNFIFVKSKRRKSRKIVKYFPELRWQNVGSAILTPFFHSVKNNYLNTWHIDADDMMFLNNSSDIINAIYKVENYANINDLDAINLDTITSNWYGMQWAFGFVYVRNAQKCIQKCIKNRNYKNNFKIIEEYKLHYINSNISDNIDLLFTILRDTNQLNLKTFYIENSVFIHEPDRLLLNYTAFINRWHNGNLEFLIRSLLFNDTEHSFTPIFKNCIKFDVGIQKDAYIDFLNSNFPYKSEFFNNLKSISELIN